MKSQVATVGERIVVACSIGAFATLLFTLKFAWSAFAMYVGFAVSGLLGALAVIGIFVVKLASRSSIPNP